ncbi:MAG: sulfurtransferase TusA family protein [Candidatus Heimdallarchaeota archaeon]|nr:MAG: sulfurtransferase TusA family protein [Candidatus Heimdallarchaeota archaeon]
MSVSKLTMFRKLLRLWLWSIIKRRWYLPEISEITVDELFDRFNGNTLPILLDLRDLVEFYGNGEYKYEKYGHIPNSKWFRLMELSSRLDDLEEFKDKEIVTICQGGGMSLVAVQIMIEAGFTDVKSLKSGIKGWKKKGYPLIKSNEDELPPDEIKLASFDDRSKIMEEIFPLDETYNGEVHYTVDARGLSCPQPVLKSKKTLKKLKIGQILEILTTDPGSKRDIPAWARVTGQELVVFEERGSQGFRFLVKRMK